MFENQKIFILGMARSGYFAAKVLAKKNNTIVLNDANENQKKGFCLQSYTLIGDFSVFL